jgi:hypothetical protein
MTESESSFQEAISRSTAVSMSQGLLCLNVFTNHRENWVLTEGGTELFQLIEAREFWMAVFFS